MNGKTIKIFLAEGTPSGVMTAEILNWTGKAIVCPRSQLVDLAARNEAKKSGIYFLIGEDLEFPAQDIVYVGESENVLDRLKIHNKDESKDYWTRTVIFISKDANLTKGHIRYVESRLIQILALANRAKLDNSTNPEYLLLPESDIADMEYFIDQIKLILPILGFNFTKPLSDINQSVITKSDEIHTESPILIIKHEQGIAQAQEINGEIILFKDSVIRSEEANSLRQTIKELRNELKEKLLMELNPQNKLTIKQNIPFNSLSAAAQFVNGYSCSGRSAWKVKDSNQTYAEWQESKLS